MGYSPGRLIKALRKAGASDREEANKVLVEYLPKHNMRFQVEPFQTETAYVPWPKEFRVGDYFCFKHTRTVTNDNTISFDGNQLQIPPGPRRRSYAKAKVDVFQHLDGCLEVCYHGQSLAIFQPADNSPVRVKKFTPASGQKVFMPEHKKNMPIQTEKQRTPNKPPANHPWRQYQNTLKKGD